MQEQADMAKAIGLLSGGLDSSLAVKVIIEQGIEVVALHFATPFCTCTRKGCQHEARKAAAVFGIQLRTVRLGAEYIELVRKPRYGYGSNMNPCIDCRILMFSRARQFMEEIGADFVFTGEVLNERPMSQNLQALRLIARESGLDGRLLRPLSAKFFEPTIPEMCGIVDRDKLLAIRGRSRRPQMALASKMGIYDYPCPAGGCRLTDPNFARRLRDAFQHGDDSMTDIFLLRYGRHLRLPNGIKMIVGRNEQENIVLRAVAKNGGYFALEAQDVVGPVVLVKNTATPADIELAARICLAYSDYRIHGDQPVVVEPGAEIAVSPISREQIRGYLI